MYAIRPPIGVTMEPRDTATAKQPRRPSSEQLDPRALARSRRSAMRRRVHRIRRAVVGFAAALFAVAFLAVYVQLASGHDPALSAKKGTTTTPTATTSSTPTTSSESSASSSSASAGSSGESSSSGTESTQGTSAVTTSQS
jgi:cytoskeletal protein RodZ